MMSDPAEFLPFRLSAWRLIIASWKTFGIFQEWENRDGCA
jgi:hypothetical protein